MPGRNKSAMATGPGGRSATAPLPWALCVAPAGLAPVFGNERRLFVRLGLRGGSAGCSSSRPSGIGSTASAAVSSGARFRKEAKAGGAARASAMNARIEADSEGPSFTRPPVTSERAICPCASSPWSAAARMSMSAMAMFMPAGYAAAALARDAPLSSRPWATSSCPSTPCVHCAAARGAACRAARASSARVVYFRERAPSAHCAKVTVVPTAVSMAPSTAGYTHSGACVANRGHQA
eukprot:2147108-Pleurochrysis_carterae.AAC.1